MKKNKSGQKKTIEEKFDFKKIFRNASIGIFIKDHSGKFQMVNKEGASMMGRKIADFIGKTGLDLFDSSEAKKIRARDREVLKLKKAIKYDRTIIVKGKKAHMTVVKYPIMDDRGRAVFLCSMARDITARKESEENLREYAKKLAALYNVSKDIDLTKDMDELLNEVAGICCYAMEKPKPYVIIWLAAERKKKNIRAFRGLNKRAGANRYLNKKGNVAALIKINGACEGGITVGYKKPGPKVSREEKRFIQEIAELLGKEMERRRIKNDLDRMFIEIVKSFSSALDARDKYTVDHSKRISNSCRLICERLNLKNKEKEDIVLGALLHDIGKIGISDGILGKPSRLTPEEFDKVKQHPLISERILEPIVALQGSMKTIRHHHEHYDGTGYPDGLRDNNIPLGARILAVCDAYDAMVSERPYRKAMAFGKALDELKKNSGSQFDPQIASLMIELVEKGMFR